MAGAMPQRALLIGSETGGLRGVYADVELMESTLGALGFSVETATHADASRRGIIRSYRELIESTESGDAALVYYSGHGGRHRNPRAREEPSQPAYIQYIVPTDYATAAGGEFNGILAEELSLLQAQLTERSANVTTIVDCCHSARMSRDGSMFPKAHQGRGAFPWESIAALYRDTRNEFPDEMNVDSNPLAVRVVACAPEQSAYELDLLDGGRHGALTATLAGLLGGSQATRLTWRQLLEGLAPAVMDLVAVQRPEIEGPVNRYLFSTNERAGTGVFTVSVSGGAAYIEANPLFGIGEGDTYAIVAPDGDPAQPLAIATVDRTVDGRAILSLEDVRPEDLTEGAEAHPLEVAFGRRPIRVAPRDAPGYARVADALADSAHARVAADGEAGVLASVELSDGMQLLDVQGEPLFDVSRPLDDQAASDLTRNLLQLARAAHLRDLSSGTGAAALDDSVTVEYSRLEGEGETPLEASGDHLFEDDRVVVRLRNEGSERRYVSVFDIGLTGTISLLSTSEPSGLSLAQGDMSELYRTAGGLTGIELFWPPDLPRGGPRVESFVTIISDVPQNLRALEQKGVRAGAPRERGRAPSALQLLVEAVTSGTRDARPQVAETVRYRVERFDFMLQPARRIDDREPPFEIDERPDPSFRLVVPRGPADLPKRVAVRLPEVVVHSNRALLKSSVRLDALVITRLEEGAGTPYHAATARFNRIRDGDRLPLDNLLVYDGPVADFLDIAVWVARDDERGLDLAELFEREAGNQEVQAAVGSLLGLAVAAPHAAVAVASAAAVATLVRVGARLLDAAVDKSIGVYRTSLLPHERFGAGDPATRHPASGLLRAQDVSLAYEVVGS
jgi:hypothetical protein